MTVALAALLVSLITPTQSHAAEALVRAYKDSGTAIPEERTIIECLIYSDGKVERTRKHGMKPSTESADAGWVQSEDSNSSILKIRRNRFERLIDDAKKGEIRVSPNSCDVGTVSFVAFPNSAAPIDLIIGNDCGAIRTNLASEARKIAEMAAKTCDIDVNFFNLEP